jgi:hypothetical protein
MSRSRLVALLFVPLAFLLMGARSILIDPEPLAVPAGITLEQVSKAIKVGVVRRGWIVEKDENSTIEASLHLRTHTARIAIPYTDKQVGIKYLSSDDLNYEERQGKRYIHSNYNNWVKNVRGDIENELRVLLIK